LVPLLESPFLHLSSDQLIQSGILPPLDAAARDGEWAWARFAPRFFAGYHRAVAGFAAAGNHAVVEHVLISQHWYEDCLRVWSEFDVFFVGVQCALTELEARERARGDRAIGTAREHVEQGVHARGEYDLVIDTSQGAVAEHAARIRSAFGARPRPSSFERALRRRCP
jgi:chloramphenicol 3-O phosphotransferase